ncbi:MAG: DHHA1 domain-containing protein, partial [Anaerolineaceae bacterium]
PTAGDEALVQVDERRRRSIMRNHTATHLLHAALRKVLGNDLHQGGSYVDPNGLRFDFNFPEAVGRRRLAEVEAEVNRSILGQYPVIKVTKTLEQAKAEGAMALFGEKYGAEVRTVQIGTDPVISYELCGGTHIDNSVEIGSFFITGESSIAAGVRRIEAITGEKAYEFARSRVSLVNTFSSALETSPEEALAKLEKIKSALHDTEKEIETLRAKIAANAFSESLGDLKTIEGVAYLTAIIPDADAETLRGLTDQFRQKHPSGVVVLATSKDGKPSLIAAVTPDLIARGLKAGELIKRVAAIIGGGGGGRPDLAQAGGKDASKLSEALDQVTAYIRENLK